MKGNGIYNLQVLVPNKNFKKNIDNTSYIEYTIQIIPLSIFGEKNKITG